MISGNLVGFVDNKKKKKIVTSNVSETQLLCFSLQTVVFHLLSRWGINVFTLQYFWILFVMWPFCFEHFVYDRCYAFSLPSFPLFVLQLPGKKDLFIEADLMSPLDRIANVSTLKVNLFFRNSCNKHWKGRRMFIQACCPFSFYLFVCLFFFTATWSGQTLQSGIQTCFQHLRSVSPATPNTRTRTRTCTHTRTWRDWLTLWRYSLTGCAFWFGRGYKLWSGYVVSRLNGFLFVINGWYRNSHF